MDLRNPIWICLFAWFAADLATAAPLVRSVKDLPADVPGEVLVQFKDGKGPADAGAAVKSLGAARTLDRLRFRKILLAAGQDMEGALTALRKDPAVEWAQPNHRYYALCSPEDPYFHDGEWPYLQIGAHGAWDAAVSPSTCPGTVPGNTSVTVAVIDSGVYSAHPDLDSSLAVPADRYNAFDGSTNSEDENGHGTFVAGIIGAEWNASGTPPASHPSPCNQAPFFTGGMAGLAGRITILPVKVLDRAGSGTSETIVKGLDHAVSRGAKVMNLSLGGTLFDTAEKAAIDRAIAAGCVVVAASGNEGGTLLFPAAYAPVVAVGATGPQGLVTGYSNRGAGLDLVAPGGLAEADGSTLHELEVDSLTKNILGTLMCPLPTGFRVLSHPDDAHYGTGAGTSFAAPFVTAAIALVLSKNPALGAPAAAERVINSATDIGRAGWDVESGYGLLNLGRALAGAIERYAFTKTFNLPNPFYPEEDGTTNIALVTDEPAEVELTVYDPSGRRVHRRVFAPHELNRNPANPQYKSFYVPWDGRNASGRTVVTGVYPYTVKIKGRQGRNKIAVIRGRR